VKLLAYELRKMLVGRFWIAALLTLIAASAVLFAQPWRLQSIGEINQTARQNSGFKPLYDFLSSASKDELDEYLSETGFSLDADAWEVSGLPLPNAGGSGRFLETVEGEFQVLQAYLPRYQRTYPQVIKSREDIVEMARYLGGSAYAEGDLYNTRLNLDIIRRYSEQPPLLLALSDGENDTPAFSVYFLTGWQSFFDFIWGDIFALILTLLVTARIFSLEKRSGSVLKSTLRGRKDTAAAKLFSACLVGGVFSLLFSALSFMMALLMYGMDGASSSILSLTPMMDTSPLTCTIGEAAWFFTFYKAFGAMCFALICAVFSCFLRSALTSYVAGSVLLGASLCWYYFLMPRASVPMVFRLLPDVTLWTRPVWMFSNYRVANIFNYPLLWVWLCLIFWLAVATLLFFAALRYWAARRLA